MKLRNFVLMTVVFALTIALPVFAADPTVTVDASLVQPIVDGIVTNINALLPVGISIMAVMIGVRLIPRIVHMFM